MTSTLPSQTGSIIQVAKEFATKKLTEELPSTIVYHGLAHTKQVAAFCAKAAEKLELPEKETTVLTLAAWFVNLGRIHDYHEPQKHSCEMASAFLEKHNYPQEAIAQVEALIWSSTEDYKPESEIERIFHDALIVSVGKKNRDVKAEMLRLELERHLDKKLTHVEWEEEELEYLLKNFFTSDFARSNYNKRRENNISKQRANLRKAIGKDETARIKRNKMGRGVETMYRAIYRTHINLSSIADAKANMMISINTIILSVIITLGGTGFTITDSIFVKHLRYMVPILILVISALLSVIFAIMSARPNVTNKNVDYKTIKQKKTSPLFFGNFVSLKLADFIRDLEQLREKQTLLYDNMGVDIYYLGQVLANKYSLLRVSYTIFMGGLIFTVVSFVGIFAYTHLL